MDYCSECRYQSERQFCASDKVYEHGQVTGITLDGSSFSIEVGWLNDPYTGNNS